MVWLDPGPSHPAAAGLLRACKGLLRPESFQGDLQCWFMHMLIMECCFPSHQANLLYCHTNQLNAFRY